MEEEEWIPPAAEKLTDDLLVEILSRVPYKSLVLSKCVSMRWRRVISHPDHRRRLPRYHLEPLAGFLYADCFVRNHFRIVPALDPPPLIDPSFSFLPKCDDLQLVDSCNGLLLCRCWNQLNEHRTFNYVVCSPTTKKFVVLPDSTCSKKIRPFLGFDPAVSSHFHVFELVEDWDDYDYDYDDDVLYDDVIEDVVGLRIYSSKTGVWSNEMDNGWSIRIRIRRDQKGGPKNVFFNGMLHLVAIQPVVALVDVEGNNWRTIPLAHKEGSPLYGAHPPYASGTEGFIALSHGLLHFASTDEHGAGKISVWVLDDYNSGQWTLQHTVSTMCPFERTMSPDDCTLVSIEERKIFFMFYDYVHCILVSYEMDSGKVRCLSSPRCFCQPPYLPYLPLFLESLADGP